MFLGRVSGEIHSTINHPFYNGHKLLIVDRIRPDGRPAGGSVIAIDRVDAGPGEVVLIMDEGNSARQITAGVNAPVRTLIVGIIDEIRMDQP